MEDSLVCSAEGCAAPSTASYALPGRVCPTETCDWAVFGLQQLVLHLEVSVSKSLCCTGTCVSKRSVVLHLNVSIFKSLCAAPRRVKSLWCTCTCDFVLHLKVSVYRICSAAPERVCLWVMCSNSETNKTNWSLLFDITKQTKNILNRQRSGLFRFERLYSFDSRTSYVSYPFFHSLSLTSALSFSVFYFLQFPLLRTRICKRLRSPVLEF